MRDTFITPAQLRAARAMLNWSREHCCEVTGVSADAIRDLEQERRKVSRNNMKRIVDAFSIHGLIFVGLDGVIKLSPKKTTVAPYLEMESNLISAEVKAAVEKIYAVSPPLV